MAETGNVRYQAFTLQPAKRLMRLGRPMSLGGVTRRPVSAGGVGSTMIMGHTPPKTGGDDP